MRLDLSTFVITGPSTNSDAILGSAGGVPAILIGNENGFCHYLYYCYIQYILGTGDDVATSTQCLSDVFSVTNQANLPSICGTMTGEHVYVDASDSCNSLDFQFGTSAVGVTALATRSVSIKVTNTCFVTTIIYICIVYWFFFKAYMALVYTGHLGSRIQIEIPGTTFVFSHPKMCHSMHMCQRI
jgi:hypothetical protein